MYRGSSYFDDIIKAKRYILKIRLISACDLETHFKCGLQCLPKAKMCDGVADCWNSHDELNCTRKSAMYFSRRHRLILEMKTIRIVTENKIFDI